MSNSLGRVIGRVLIFLVPIIFAIAIIRIAYVGFDGGSYELIWDADHTIVESIEIHRGSAWLTWNELYPLFGKFPNLADYITQMYDDMNINSLVYSVINVDGWSAFWNMIGNFFRAVGAVFTFVGRFLWWPFEVIGWIIEVFITPAG